jgi:hypothetical protein
MTTLTASGTACRSPATPLKGSGIAIPSLGDLLKPGDDLIWILWMLAIQGTSFQDTLDGFSHVQP